MDRAREVLVGKLAIGRGVLSREAAVRCFHAALGEPFWEVAVRQGLLPRAQADALVQRVDQGQLVCRGKCGQRIPLAGVSPQRTDRCERCGGPVYVAGFRPLGPTEPMPRPELAPSPTIAAPAEGNGGDIELSPDFSPQAPTLAPQRPGAPPPQKVSDSSLPSAIPIPAPRAPAAAPRAESRSGSGTDDTKIAPPASKDSSFVPFSLGDFDIVAPIGRGGMGSVYRALHRVLKKMVAIKVLTASTDDQKQRFDREIKATATLDHPNIVKVIRGGVVSEPGPLQGHPYFAMDYVPGRDLAAWVNERPRSLREIVDMTVKICEAIHYAHNRQIIHRDLKPQNVLISHDGDVPKICDFGLAKVSESNLTRTGDIMGTPQYMPPEQILGERSKIGPPTDVYGLGAVLYHLLTGGPPFNARALHELTRMVVKDVPVPPSQKNPRIPPELDAVVLKALEKQPVNRFITARDLSRALAGLSLPA